MSILICASNSSNISSCVATHTHLTFKFSSFFAILIAPCPYALALITGIISNLLEMEFNKLKLYDKFFKFIVIVG